jgi:hypothetical protein
MLNLIMTPSIKQDILCTPTLTVIFLIMYLLFQDAWNAPLAIIKAFAQVEIYQL